MLGEIVRDDPPGGSSSPGGVDEKDGDPLSPLFEVQAAPLCVEEWSYQYDGSLRRCTIRRQLQEQRSGCPPEPTWMLTLICGRAQISLLTRYFIVELPGIEPVIEIALTCGNAECHDAKVRETTC
jgi:hypothetical protein